MAKYPVETIEPKWQRYWEEHKTFRAVEDPAFPKEKRRYVFDKAGMKQLAAFGKVQSDTAAAKDAAATAAADTPNLVEVMTCPGGCIAGPSVIVNPKAALRQLEGT